MKIKLLVALLASTLWCGWAQAQDFNSSYNFVAKGTQGPGTSFANTQVSAFAISWNTSATVASCAVQVDSSADGVTWGSADLIASQNCAVVGSVAATALAAGKNFVRINVTTLTGNGGLNVNLKGYASSGSSSSSPSPGVFNSNFDPPLFQNYSLATTGAQAAINLTANPIDTHTITWRPSGTVSTCTVALDTSADGVSWTAGGAIAGQTCTSAGSFTSANLSANFVRVNLTTLTGGGTLTVVYSGRLAPAAAVGGTASVSNGQWVQAGEIIWVQDTTQSNLGTMSLHSSARILQPNGTVTTNAWDTSCNSGITSGVGTGFTVAASGWLQSLTTYVVSAGIPQGAVYTNLYILNSMPSGGNQATCVGTLTTTNIGILLAGTPTGSFYPVSFVGTTSLIQSPYSIPGFTAENIIANPAAGAEISKNFGAGNSARTCIQGLSFQLVTSATVANRTVSVRINTGTTPVQMFYVAGTVQAASATVLYSFAPGTTASQTALGALNVQTVPFNNGQMFCVSPGTALSISTVTNNLQAGDQYSNIDVMTQVQQDNN